jgi:hypothetical protein
LMCHLATRRMAKLATQRRYLLEQAREQLHGASEFLIQGNYAH